MSSHAKARPLFDPSIVKRAVIDALRKLDPRHQIRNPVMFTVFVGSILTTGLWVQALVGEGEAPRDSSLPFQHGCGSPCCSQTLQRRWPKAAVKLKPIRCALREGR